MKDLVGKKFNKWEVIGFFEKRTRWREKQPMLICRCECGKEAIQYPRNITKGFSKSCQRCGSGSKKHNLYKHKVYRLWTYIKQRCSNENRTEYCDYGGRGIKVCAEWEESPEVFIKWCLENGWKEGLQIDRKDNDAGYSPENCRFVTGQKNSRNSRLMKSSNRSGFRGVSVLKQLGGTKYRACVSINSHKFILGHFDTAEEAAQVRDSFIIHCGIPLHLNFPRVGFDRELVEDALDMNVCLKKAKEELDRIKLSRVSDDYDWESLKYTPPKHSSISTKARKDNTSGVIGVCKLGKKWGAQIQVSRKKIYIGTYETIEEAAAARLEMEIKYNFPNRNTPAGARQYLLEKGLLK